MSVDITRIAELSKIYFSEADLLDMEKDMASIIRLMDSLRDVTLPEHESGFESELTLSELRADTTLDSLPQTIIVSQSPQGGDFRLPKIIE